MNESGSSDFRGRAVFTWFDCGGGSVSLHARCGHSGRLTHTPQPECLALLLCCSYEGCNHRAAWRTGSGGLLVLSLQPPASQRNDLLKQEVSREYTSLSHKQGKHQAHDLGVHAPAQWVHSWCHVRSPHHRLPPRSPCTELSCGLLSLGMWGQPASGPHGGCSQGKCWPGLSIGEKGRQEDNTAHESPLVVLNSGQVDVTLPRNVAFWKDV